MLTDNKIRATEPLPKSYKRTDTLSLNLLVSIPRRFASVVLPL